MKPGKRRALEAAGFRVGDIEEFLGLADGERQLIDLRVAISREIRRLREQRKMSQQTLAEQIHSSQSRVAKMEAGSANVSLDLLFRGFFAVGGKLADLTPGKKHKSKTSVR